MGTSFGSGSGSGSGLGAGSATVACLHVKAQFCRPAQGRGAAGGREWPEAPPRTHPVKERLTKHFQGI